MDAVAWSAVIAGGVLGLAILVQLIRLTRSLTMTATTAEGADKKADKSIVAFDLNKLEIERIRSELTDHRIAVAREYVTQSALHDMELKIMNGFRDLTLRLDTLFRGSDRKEV